MANGSKLLSNFQGAPLSLQTWLNSQSLKVNDLEIISQAFIHPSARSQGNPHYERLEFLGDRVLGLVIAELLYKTFPKEKEGALARRFASLVNRETLTEVAEESNLSQFLEEIIAEIPNSQQRRITILSDTCEAVLGALYLDGGLESASQFIQLYWEKRLAEEKSAPKDPKSRLQELLQKQGKMPLYEVLESTGPAHSPLFIIQVSVPEGPSLQVKAGSKREGERMAAQEMLKVIQNVK